MNLFDFFSVKGAAACTSHQINSIELGRRELHPVVEKLLFRRHAAARIRRGLFDRRLLCPLCHCILIIAIPRLGRRQGEIRRNFGIQGIGMIPGIHSVLIVVPLDPKLKKFSTLRSQPATETVWYHLFERPVHFCSPVEDRQKTTHALCTVAEQGTVL